jgi:hypothetical protein
MKERQGGQDRRNKSKPNQPEHSEGGKSLEPDQPPSVWDMLERQVKLWAPGGPRMDRKEFASSTLSDQNTCIRSCG